MKSLLRWWYRVSLPLRPPSDAPTAREQERYAQLTARLLLLIICVFTPLAPLMIFFSTKSPSARPDGIGVIILLIVAWFAGRVGRQRLSAACIIALTFLVIAGPLLTSPLNSELVPLFSIFTISIILAGALLPPVAALITGLISCLFIIMIASLNLNTKTYNTGDQIHYQTMNTVAIAVILPIIIQIVVAVIVYAIVRNLLDAIRRADRAEEIVALQTEIADHEQERLLQQSQLEDGLERIAEAHARIANGDYMARVSLSEGDVLWSIAIPLNNLLNRLQSWKSDSDNLRITHQAAAYIAERIRTSAQTGQKRDLPLTKTAVDPIIVEINKVVSSSQPMPTRTSRPL